MRKAIGLIMVLALLVAWPTASYAEHLDVCGIVSGYPPCVTFNPFDRGELDQGWYGFIQADTLQDGMIFHLVADTQPCPPGCDLAGAPECIGSYTIAPCPPQNVGCGVLHEVGSFCWRWTSPQYGHVEVGGPCWDCVEGAVVQAEGYLDYTFFSFCGIAPAVLMRPTLYPCPTPVLGTTWGRLKAMHR